MVRGNKHFLYINEHFVTGWLNLEEDYTTGNYGVYIAGDNTSYWENVYVTTPGVAGNDICGTNRDTTNITCEYVTFYSECNY